MEIGIVTDEISRDPVTACELAQQWGLRHLELRRWYRSRPPEDMTDADIAELRGIAADNGLDFYSISPGLFKVCADDPRLAEHRGDLQKRSLDLAEGLGAGLVIAFAYIRGEGEGHQDWPPAMIDDFRALGEAAAGRGRRVALENEAICFGPTGQTMAKLVAEIDHPNVGINWDPGNQLVADGTPWDAGYEHVRDRMVHCHVKDYVLTDGEPKGVPPGEGEVGWAGQVKALGEDCYAGLLMLETHFTPRVAGSRDSLAALRGLLQAIGETAR